MFLGGTLLLCKHAAVLTFEMPLAEHICTLTFCFVGENIVIFVLFSVYFLQHFFLTSVFICKKGLLSFTSMVQVTVITGNFYRI